jgi:predicted transcriptional regulator of viral defense system
MKKFKVVLDVVEIEPETYRVQLESYEAYNRTKITATEIDVTSTICDEFAKQLTEEARNRLLHEADDGMA